MNDVVATSTANTSPSTPLDFTQPQRFVRVGEDDIAYWRTGSGPDLVLVHGWPLHAATFRDLVPALAEHFTCHLFDLPGAGHTKSPTNRAVGLASHKRTLLGLIDELDIERCAMLGHDSGAAIMRLAAEELGDRVWAIVMGNTEIPGHHPWLVVAFGLLARLGGTRIFNTMLSSRWLRHSYFAYGSCFQDRSLIDGAFHDLFVQPMLESPDVAEGQMRLLHGFDWADVDELDAIHQRITAPVQLIWGENDPYFPLAKARQMRFGGPMELEVIENTKLFAHEEASEQFASHATRFLREHGPKR
jgi:pimeloyl-ACP methyl ester carboxylesterase